MKCYHKGYKSYIWKRDDLDRETDTLKRIICLDCGQDIMKH